ncbi:MAG: hypothetical protein AAB267_04420, partial [Candidatus Desantisbacteria bacterium]
SPEGSVTGAGIDGDPYVVTWTGSSNWGYIGLTVKVGTNTPSVALTNVVRIEGTSSMGGSDPLWNNQATVTTSVNSPIVDLRIRKIGPKQVKPGQEITYTISYANQGNTSATATVIDTLPAGVTYATATKEPATVTAEGKIVWEVGTISPGNVSLGVISSSSDNVLSGVMLSFKLTVLVGTDTSTETLTNIASITTNSLDSNPANNQDTAITCIVNPVVDLCITKSAPKEVAPGQIMEYHITYRNKGNSDAGSVTITDELPDGVTYLGDNSGFGTGSDGNKITWDVGTVSPSLWAKSFKVRVEVGNLPASTTLINRIKIQDYEAMDNNQNNNQATTTTQVVVPVGDLAVYKTGTADVTPNGTMTYHIWYKNKGNIEVDNVTITDTLPVGVTYLNDNSGISSTITTNGQIV